MDNIASAVEFVANHFDTVEKAGTNVAGVVIAAAAFWISRKTISALAYFARCTYAAAKHRVSPPHDPVFARLLQHFDDPDAMVTSANGVPYRLETGTLDIQTSPTDGIKYVRDTKNKGYDVYNDLTAAERKTLASLIEAKMKAVIERDRLARRATLSAPTV